MQSLPGEILEDCAPVKGMAPCLDAIPVEEVVNLLKELALPLTKDL